VLAETFAFDYMPDMAMFVSSAPTLRDAAKVLDLLPVLFDPALSVSLTEMGAQARLLMRYNQLGESVEVSAPFIETSFALFIKLSSTLLGPNDTSRRISFRHAPNQGREACAAFYGVTPQYGQPADALWFDRVALDRRLRGAVEMAHTSSAQRLQDHVAGMQSAQRDAPMQGLAASLVTKMVNDPAVIRQDLQALADQVGMHPRTLQRRLKAEGSSYSDVLDQARFQLADQWLKQDKAMTLEFMAHSLGFADRSGFTLAFSRWTGTTPSQYRSR
jgi:AraC-like DNA-binding protein